MQDFEKLGVFYLGRSYDLAKKKRCEDLLLYDSRDLVTHAVCVGMTGSGKTGLCLSLIEEAAIDGVPAILIDPKGDLCDLLLTFPGLSPGSSGRGSTRTTPRARDVSADDYAKQQAELWTKGLAEWGQDGDRIRRLKDAAEFAIYTPGSSAGLPVSILEVVRGAAGRRARRRGGAAGARRVDGDRSPDAARRRRRSAQEPRAHPRLDDPRRRLEQRRGPRLSTALIARIQTPRRRNASASSTSSRSSRRRSDSRSR